MAKVIRLMLILLIGLSFTSSFGQDIVKSGLVRAQLTISPSFTVPENQSYFYLHGTLENYLSQKLSIAGEGYFYLGELSSGNNTFDFNHSLFLGGAYHFLKNNNDLYIGIQPGISFTKINDQENVLTPAQMGINPLVSTVVGYNLYVHKIFHFFIQSRFVLGEHNYDMHKNLNEIRFSAGLGFNF